MINHSVVSGVRTQAGPETAPTPITHIHDHHDLPDTEFSEWH